MARAGTRILDSGELFPALTMETVQSPKAPQAMNNMMEMARRMGNGDTMLGMTKMMEMMGGGMGGMMGGQASPGVQREK